MNVPKSLLVLFITALCAMFLSPVSSCMAYRGGSGLPSCHDDIASVRDKAGTGPDCTPPILDQETSAKFLKEFTVRKIQGKWYLFLAQDEFVTLDVPARWKSISLLVSTVQSLFGDNADCHIARIPVDDEEKKALLKGQYPAELISASAVYVKMSAAEKETTKWPEYHHHVLYRLSVSEMP